MKDNQSFYDFIFDFPIVKGREHVKQSTIQKAGELLSQQTKYTGAKLNFVLNQLKNISKVFWLIQFICFVLFLVNFTNIKELEDAQILFLTLVPVMTFYILPELLKTQLYNMGEMEAACFFSPIKILAVKMVLVGSCNILIIGIVSLVFGFYHQINVLELLCRGLIPFNISIALTIIAFDFIKITSPYAMISVSALLTLVLIEMRHFTFLFHNIWLGVYFGSVVLMLLAVGITVIRLKHIEERCYGT